MPDGCRLAARIWLPEGAKARPVPAIVEYIPYRKRDNTRQRDEPMHRYFAGHGYASVRIDLRGSGDSDGLLLDEYLEQEQQDGLAAIRWLAEQPWCNGSVGMMGKSWGGFNSLQIAALRPPELRAIIAVCCADDRYTDDAHYKGGCLLNENLIWGAVLFTFNAQPPDPALVGDRWEAMWRDRLENDPLFPEIWLEHQWRDDYWRHGSASEMLDRIDCPVYAIGGWADGYRNAVPRLMAGLRVPRKGLVGPWAHLYPHEGVPGPAIGFLQEALRWWDHWLRDADTGIMDEPVYRVWMQESVRPRAYHPERPGRWVAERAWPSRRIEHRRFTVMPSELVLERPVESVRLEMSSPQDTGLAAGSWVGTGHEFPGDQRADDERSLFFDSAPLGERLEILGAPSVILDLSVDQPRALIAVRLNDVAPDASSSRVSYGLLNLTHRAGHERPAPVEPGARYTVSVRLDDIAHAFPPGHRIRLAISTSYWPMAWPAPRPVNLTLYTGGTGLELPIRPHRPEDADLRPFEPPEGGAPPISTDLDAGGLLRTVERDPSSGLTIYRSSIDTTEDGEPAMSRLEAIDMEFGHGLAQRFEIDEGDPLSARAEIVQKVVFRREGWATEVETRMALSADERNFRLEAELIARHNGERRFARRWDRRVARRLV